jgi:ring-1,2-phenylacetyl-CoA epoxidase subunit PaaC
VPTATTEPKLKKATLDALVDLLYRLGDDSLALGHRNSEWTGQGPILEEDIAFSSMAQDKLGHAQAFYRLLHELGEPDPESLVYRREPEQFRCCKLAAMPRGTWAFSLVRHFFFAEADHVWYSALAESSYGPLAALARKLRGEVKYHVMHGRSMMKHMARGTREGRENLEAALDESFGMALGIFEPTSFDGTLASEGICRSPAQLEAPWFQVVNGVLQEAGIKLREKSTPVYGGRVGRHGPELSQLLEALQRVWKLDPGATW